MNAGLITVEQFIDSLTDTGQYAQITDTKRLLSLQECKGKTDIHFTSGLRNPKGSGKGGRAKDTDIGRKSYFLLDYDIRSSVYESHGTVMTKDDLFMVMENIKSSFTGIYKSWKYIVYSGNGFHVYYEIVPKEYDPKDYKIGVREVIKQAPFQGMLDLSVSNIANLSRLPGFMNTKTYNKYGLLNEMCEVVALQEDVDPIDITPLIAIADMRRRIEEKKHEQRRRRQTSTTKFDQIDAIPTYKLVEHYKGIQLSSDGREFKDKNGMNRGIFYDADKNLIIDNGTHYLTGGLQGYNPYTFIKYEVLGGSASFKEVQEELRSNGFID